MTSIYIKEASQAEEVPTVHNIGIYYSDDTDTDLCQWNILQ